MTLSALSEELNCSRDHISKVENNRRCPSLDMLAELSAYFGVSMDYLIFGEDCDSFQIRADLLKVLLLFSNVPNLICSDVRKLLIFVYPACVPELTKPGFPGSINLSRS